MLIFRLAGFRNLPDQLLEPSSTKNIKTCITATPTKLTWVFTLQNGHYNI